MKNSENEDYPKESEFKNFGLRGVLHSWANPDGTLKIEDAGPLTIKRMETIDVEITTATPGFIDRKHACMLSAEVIQRHLWFTL